MGYIWLRGGTVARNSLAGQSYKPVCSNWIAVVFCNYYLQVFSNYR